MEKGPIMAVDRVPIRHITIPTARAILEAQKHQGLAAGMLPSRGPSPLGSLTHLTDHRRLYVPAQY